MKTFEIGPSVVEELLNRRRDLSLVANVEGFMKDYLKAFPSKPFAYLPRQIATVRNEDLAFCQYSNDLGLMPWWPEYTHDLFTTANPDKMSYLKLITGPEYQRKNFKLAFPPDRWTGKTLSEIVLESGQSLVDFHHTLRDKVFPLDVSGSRYDFSGFYLNGSSKTSPRSYYPYLLGISLVHGIMFEDFYSGPNAKSLQSNDFVGQVVEPACGYLKQKFGIDPLIVHFPWRDEYKLYPDEIHKSV